MKGEVLSMKNKRTGNIALAVVLLLIIGGLAGYFLWYTKTPEYSVYQIKKAVDKHDWSLFSRHVDTKNVIGKAFDDVVAVALEDNEMDESVKGLASGFAMLVRPMLVENLTDQVKTWVETGSFGDEEDKKKEAPKDKSDGLKADKISRDVDFDHWDYKGIANVDKGDDTTMVGVQLHNDSLNKDFVLQVELKKTEDGYWRVREVKNLRDFLREAKSSLKK